MSEQPGINLNVTAYLLRRYRNVGAHGLEPPYTFGALIDHVMKKLGADRQPYSIMVGKKVYNLAAIEKLHEDRRM